MKVHMPKSIVDGVYQNSINYENVGIAISQLFGIITNDASRLELIILYTTESVSSNEVDKLSNDVEMSLPWCVNKLSVFVKSQNSVNLDNLINKICGLGVEYVIVNEYCMESHVLKLFSIKYNNLEKLECEFNILSNEFDLLKKFGYNTCNYTIFIEDNISIKEIKAGLHVSDKSLAMKIKNLIESIDLEQLTIDGDSDTFNTDISVNKIIEDSEAKYVNESNTVISLLAQICVLFKNGTEKHDLESMVKQKFFSFVTYVGDKVKVEDYDYLTAAITKVEVKNVENEECTDEGRMVTIGAKIKSKGNIKGKIKGSKGSKPKKKSDNNPKNIISNKSISLANRVSYTPITKTGKLDLNIEFNPSNSAIIINPQSDTSVIEGDNDRNESDFERNNCDTDEKNHYKISLLFKLESLKSICGFYQSIPVTIPFYRLVNQLNISTTGYNTYNKLPYLINTYNPRSLLPDNIVINPHAKMERPYWISPKNSSVAVVSGKYAYYHYCMDDIEDSGWGCCYRSLQMVWSWYLLQNYTVAKVPNHWEIQRILNENDTTGRVIKVGSDTWIGTVECSYIINWKLNMICKIYYLSDSSYLPDYSMVIKEHLLVQKTPIIIAVGCYAYVIVGICIDNDNEPTYLIADPHYSGQNSLKSIASKGVGWKRIDFLNKVVDSGFINLLLPQTSLYND
ncbi:Peptidase family C78 [Babesia microti strain RI]|uniref:Peptidase family C78 n=1 Tax=Babesia microti (strain RI) TaxID=1133968 RepID=A0A1N6LXT8_BABMR|nr:Peptidase family C78 [Babesia microti strain RI]SIO73684.1 Peptidase family C78 [Babesia microti strain RI]|eukprot:XP_021337753.1 Peptidase family C78 [Babesia microti strain RI]